MPVIRQLEADHGQGEGRVRQLQHLLAAWELLGDERRPPFQTVARDYVRFYLNHMRTEEVHLLPVAARELAPADWVELDAVFCRDRDPLAGGEAPVGYERLFSRIVLKAVFRSSQAGEAIAC